VELKTVYFEHPGAETTETALSITRERARELGIKKILVASTTGDTAVKAMDAFQGKRRYKRRLKPLPYRKMTQAARNHGSI